MSSHNTNGVFKPLEGDDPQAVAGYRISAKLGAGGMGKVYLSYTPGGRPVAIKVIRPELSEDAEFRRRFRQEVQSAQRVQGLYTAPVIDSDADGNHPWLATAYVPGPALSAAVIEHGKLPVETVLLLVAGIAEALHVIHGAGIVHRDLKPSNVLLAADGPRVIDFGIARAADATSLTGSGVTIGTPSFMAPEQAAGRPCTPATDVFALGQVAAFAAMGTPAFGEGTSHGVLYRIVHEEPDLTGLPEDLRELVTRCLAKDPAARPSVMEVIALCQAANAETVLRRPEDWLPTAVAADITQRAAAPAPVQTPPPVQAPPAPGQQAAPPAPAQPPVAPVQAPAAPVAAPAPQDIPPAVPLPTAGMPAAQQHTPPQGAAPMTHPQTAPATQVQGPGTPPPGFGPSPYDTAALQQPAPGTPPGGTPPYQQGTGAYPGHPNPGAAAAPEPKEGRTLLAVAIAALVFGVGGAAGAYALLKDDDKGERNQQAGSDGTPAQDGSDEPATQDPVTDEPSGAVDPTESGTDGTDVVQDPEPVEFKGIDLVDGYHLSLADKPVRPADSEAEGRQDVVYDGYMDASLTTNHNNKYILLNDTQEPTLKTCREETRYTSSIDLDNVSKGSNICLLTTAGHIGMIKYNGRAPASDQSNYVKLDVTVWRNAMAAEPEN
ncbi:serine/threonine-protein kinase [Streptomyces sp. N35]|uniref:serine/threonine-protein kinase n=1 Tax=Streptomyces sp. N35 TaxID=2795730 RepID=UPI0018F3A6A5|nr:serine/threonine-protein kinase [Streptomyces sp. N35]